jgi:hypothetical protein
MTAGHPQGDMSGNEGVNIRGKVERDNDGVAEGQEIVDRGQSAEVRDREKLLATAGTCGTFLATD